MSWRDGSGCLHDPKVIKLNELSNFIDKKKAEITALRNERDSTLDKFFKKELKNKVEDAVKALKPYTDERSALKKTISKNVMCEERYYRFLKQPKGVIPTILQNLLDARKNTRSEMKNIKKENGELTEDLNLLLNVLDKRQLAYKVSCNSMYGAWGVRKGYLPFMPGAMCTTYMGRVNIEKVANAIQQKYKGELVYGDSVLGDTPILIRRKDLSIDIKTIETLGEEWKSYEQFKSEDSNRKEKQQSDVELEVWTNGKWSKIKRVIRHKTNKRIFRINTHIGCIDVSEDHSLLDEFGEKVKPTEVDIGFKLLHSFPKEFNNVDINKKIYEDENVKCGKCKETKPKYEFYEKYKKKICRKCIWVENSIYRTNKRGIIKDYFSEEEYFRNAGNNITEEEAFIWGFFMGDGSCGTYKQKNGGNRYSWALNNSNLEYLNRAKACLEKVESEFTFKILDTIKSSGVYKLVPLGRIRLIVKKYRSLFYDKDKYFKQFS